MRSKCDILLKSRYARPDRVAECRGRGLGGVIFGLSCKTRRLETRKRGDYISPGNLSFPPSSYGERQPPPSGGRQQHEQSVVEVGTGRSHAGDVGSGLRLVGRPLEGRLRPGRGAGQSTPPHVGGMEPHPAHTPDTWDEGALERYRSMLRGMKARHHTHDHPAPFFRSTLVLYRGRLGTRRRPGLL